MNLVKIVTLVFASIATYEVFLQNSPFSSGITPMVYDKDIGMWHKRSFSSNLIKDCYKNLYVFDEFGRVSNNYQYDKAKKDIVLIGDSQIEGLSVNNENVIHNSLYRELSGEYNVLNYALAGSGPSQQFEILKKKVHLNNVDTLIHFIYLENDLNDGDPENIDGTNRPKVYHEFSKDLKTFKVIKPALYNYKEKLRDFIGNFELYVFLKKTYHHYKKIYSTNPTSLIIYEPDQNIKPAIDNADFKWLQLEGAIYQINILARKYGFKYETVVLSSFEKKHGFLDYRNRLKDFLKKNEISFINILPFIKVLEHKGPLSFSCDAHWNDETHQELAKFIKNNIF